MKAATTTTADRLAKARIKLLMSDPRQPFFSTLLMGMNVKEDATVTKSANNGNEIKCNPEYIDTLTTPELTGHLCSAVMQTALMHNLRRNGRDQTLWSRACQFAANQIVKNAGLTLPKDALLDPRFTNHAAEDIYRTLQEEKQKDDKGKQQQPDPNEKPQGAGQPQQQQQPSPNGNGQQQPPQEPQQDAGPMEVQDAPAETESQKQEQEAKTKQKVAQAMQAAKRAGRMPGDLEEMIEELMKPVINWHEVINRFICDIARNDYSFSKANTRFLHTGFILPSLYNVEPNDIIFLVDKSYSMDEEIFQQIGSEIKDAAGQIRAGLTLIYVDTEVQGEPILIEPDDNMPFLCRPSGGTDFAPGFEYIEEHQLDPKAVIYLTDGDCDSYPETYPDYPVLWIVYNNKKFVPPFGEVIEIESN